MNSKEIKKLLQKRKLKVTPTRLELLSSISENGSSMSYSAIQKALEPIDRVTLYRTIESLKEKGIIHKAFQDKNETYYAICGVSCAEDHHHHDHLHFKCLICNTISCEKLENPIEFSLPNFIINKTSINLEGTCKLCI